MKNRIIFLPVPETLHEQLAYKTQDEFQINPGIPIPVEITGDTDIISLENLSIEMILSGMLRVIQEGEADPQWLEYYSCFVLALRPDILTRLKELKNCGLYDESFIKAHKLIQEGKTEEGLGHIRIFLEQRPLVWNGWFVLGWALRLLGRYTDGETAFRKAIELGGDTSDTRNELAICLMEKGDTVGARRELEAALKEDPENVKIISNLGVLALKDGDKDKAAAFFRTILEIDENDPVAGNYLKDNP